MAVWYIDPRISAADESDSFDGGFGSGKLRDSWADVTWAVADIYAQARGSVWPFRLAPTATPANEGQRVTICAYGTGARPIIQGHGTANGAADDNGIHMSTRPYYTFRGLHVKAAPGTTSGRGINALTASATTAQHHLIDDCWITNANIGTQLRGAGSKILRTDFETIREDCAYLEVADFETGWCTGRDFANYAGSTGDFMQFAGTHDHGRVWVHHNKSWGHTDNPEKHHYINKAGTGTFIFEDIECYGLRVGIIAEFPGTIMRRIKTRGQTVRGIGISAATCLLELSDIGDTDGGVQITSSVTDAVLRNNTINVRGTGVFLGSSSGATLRNNAITAAIGIDRYSGVTLDSDSNAFDPATRFWLDGGTTVYATLAAWTAAQSTDANSKYEALLTTSDGRPLPGSPLLTGGADLGYRRDIRGYLSRKHIGAFGAARLVRP